ncbi:hypothetical protein AALB64_11775 [Lachnospiraceae bacterium 45-P1]
MTGMNFQTHSRMPASNRIISRHPILSLT